MGSTISSPQGHDEGDVSAKGKKDSVDPILEKLRSLHVATPILKLQTTDASLTEILMRQSSSQSSEGLDPTSTVKLFELYQEWQRATAAKVGKNQHEIFTFEPCNGKKCPLWKGFMACSSSGSGRNTLRTVIPLEAYGGKDEELGYQIIGVEELSMKLLQRLNYASRVMEASASHLQEVHSLQDEIVEVKRKLAKTLENYEKLSQRVDALGLQNKNIKPMAIVNPLIHGKDNTDGNILSSSESSQVSATGS